MPSLLLATESKSDKVPYTATTCEHTRLNVMNCITYKLEATTLETRLKIKLQVKGDFERLLTSNIAEIQN